MIIDAIAFAAGYLVCFMYQQRISDWFHAIPAAVRAEADALIEKAKF